MRCAVTIAVLAKWRRRAKVIFTLKCQEGCYKKAGDQTVFNFPEDRTWAGWCKLLIGDLDYYYRRHFWQWALSECCSKAWLGRCAHHLSVEWQRDIPKRALNKEPGNERSGPAENFWSPWPWTMPDSSFSEYHFPLLNKEGHGLQSVSLFLLHLLLVSRSESKCWKVDTRCWQVSS